MESFYGQVAAITGAGSGIGRALALELADHGADLALSDIDEDGLAETVALCEGRVRRPITHQRLDVADRTAVFEWADQVIADHGQANLIFNNAGVALGAPVSSMTIEDFEWLMGINFWGVVYGTKAFLPHLEASGNGHVVNISSVFGLVSVPTQSAYNASKFAVRGFTDALRIELEIAKSPVSATTVHPGGIRTNIARRARIDENARALAGSDSIGDQFDKVARTTADAAAKQILEAVRKNRRRALIGPDARVIDSLARMPSSIVQRGTVVGARLRRRPSRG